MFGKAGPAIRACALGGPGGRCGDCPDRVHLLCSLPLSCCHLETTCFLIFHTPSSSIRAHTSGALSSVLKDSPGVSKMRFPGHQDWDGQMCAHGTGFVPRPHGYTFTCICK